MVTTGFWLSSLFICCLYALQAYVFKGKQQNSCVFINCSERDKCKGESTKPQSKRSNFHWPQWQNPGSLQQNWASQDVLKLISEGFFPARVKRCDTSSCAKHSTDWEGPADLWIRALNTTSLNESFKFPLHPSVLPIYSHLGQNSHP